jgi:hypothetical protein
VYGPWSAPPGVITNLSGSVVTGGEVPVPFPPPPEVTSVTSLPLIVSFSVPVSAVTLSFATNQLARFNVQVFAGGVGGEYIGGTNVLSVPISPEVFYAEGVISFTSAAQPFDTLEFSISIPILFPPPPPPSSPSTTCRSSRQVPTSGPARV